MKRFTIIAIATLTVVGCGGGGGGSSAVSSTSSISTSAATGSGKIALKVSGAKSFNPTITPGKISQYQVTVSGPGFEPVVAIIEGDAAEATVSGIPTGEGRMVQIAAINPNGQKIREGEAANVLIPEDTVAEVAVTLQAVPVITNVAEGAHLANTRLRFSIFSDPATLVELRSNTGESSEVLTDMVENRPTVATDAATGLAAFVPPKLAPGDYLLTVVDAKTGRKSEVTVTVTDGSRERGAPLVSGARQKSAGGLMQTGGIVPATSLHRVGMTSAVLGMRLE